MVLIDLANGRLMYRHDGGEQKWNKQRLLFSPYTRLLNNYAMNDRINRHGSIQALLYPRLFSSTMSYRKGICLVYRHDQTMVTIYV